MDFQTKILLIAFAITVVLGTIIVPILRKLKVGQIERDDGPETHLKKQGTPTMGGIIIMLGIIIVTRCRTSKKFITNIRLNNGIWTYWIYR